MMACFLIIPAKSGNEAKIIPAKSGNKAKFIPAKSGKSII